METLEELITKLPSDIRKDGRTYWLSFNRELMDKWSGGYYAGEDNVISFLEED